MPLVLPHRRTIRNAVPRSNRRAFSTTLLYALAWTTVIALATSDAALEPQALKALGLLGCLWVAAWTLRFAHWVYRRRPGSASFHATQTQTLLPQGWLLWAIEPAVCMLTVLAAHAGLFLLVRLQVSAPMLTQYVQTVNEDSTRSERKTYPPRQLGLYTVTDTQLLADGTVRLQTSASSAVRASGFAHVPGSEAPMDADMEYVHLSGPWWRWTQRL